MLLDDICASIEKSNPPFFFSISFSKCDYPMVKFIKLHSFKQTRIALTLHVSIFKNCNNKITKKRGKERRESNNQNLKIEY